MTTQLRTKKSLKTFWTTRRNIISTRYQSVLKVKSKSILDLGHFTTRQPSQTTRSSCMSLSATTETKIRLKSSMLAHQLTRSACSHRDTPATKREDSLRPMLRVRSCTISSKWSPSSKAARVYLEATSPRSPNWTRSWEMSQWGMMFLSSFTIISLNKALSKILTINRFIPSLAKAFKSL